MSNSDEDVRDLTAVAAMTAISVILLLIYRFVPFSGSVIMFFSSLPIIYTTTQKKLKFLLIQVIATIILIFYTTADPRYLLLFSTDFLIIGLTLGLCIKYNLNAANTIVLSALVVTATFLLALFFLKKAGFDMKNDLRLIVDKFIQLMKSNSRVSDAHIRIVQGNFYKMIGVGFPSLIFSASLIHITISYFVAYRVIKPLKNVINRLEFIKIRLPGYYIWLLIVGIIMTLPKLSTYTAGFYTIGYNLNVILLAVFTLFGISFLNFYLMRIKIHLIWKILINFILITQIWWILATTAILDYWLDFRKIKGGRRKIKGGRQ